MCGAAVGDDGRDVALLPLFTLLLAQQRWATPPNCCALATMPAPRLMYWRILSRNRNPLVAIGCNLSMTICWGRRGQARPGDLALLRWSSAGACARGPKGAPCGLLCCGASRVSVGPILRVNGQFYPNIPTPYRFCNH